ncbi:hypothetical protein JCM1840_007366 [Sporobolomyces johnsonii]
MCPASVSTSVFNPASLDSPSPPGSPTPDQGTSVLPPQLPASGVAHPAPKAAECMSSARQASLEVPFTSVEGAEAHELDLAANLRRELVSLDLQGELGESLEDFAMSAPVEVLQARVDVTGSAILFHHERTVLFAHLNCFDRSVTTVPNYLLTPTGDIPVELDIALTDSPESNSLLRLNPTYAGKLSRLTRLILLPPFTCPSDSHPFSPAVLQKRAEVLAVAISEKTMGYYGYIVLRFLEFCEKEHVPLPQRFPIPRNTALLFLSSLAGSLAADTIRTYFNGLKTWHLLHDVELDVPETAWRFTLKGIKKQAPLSKAQRPPATFHDLLAICKHLNLENGYNACFWAACCTAFWAMARPSDVSLENRTSFDPEYDATPADAQFFDATADFPAHTSIHLPYDKVNGKKGDDLILMNQSDKPELDPIAALKNHLAINHPLPDQFLYSSLPWDASQVHLIPLTGDHFCQRVNDILKKEKHPIIAGHSWRIGGATFYLLAGVHPDFIHKVGRWRSEAFYRYWREIKVLAALNLQDAACVDVGEARGSRSTKGQK